MPNRIDDNAHGIWHYQVEDLQNKRNIEQLDWGE